MKAKVCLNWMFSEEKLSIAVQNHQETIQSLQMRSNKFLLKETIL